MYHVEKSMHINVEFSPFIENEKEGKKIFFLHLLNKFYSNFRVFVNHMKIFNSGEGPKLILSGLLYFF